MSLEKSEARAYVDATIGLARYALGLGEWRLDVDYGPCSMGPDFRGQCSADHAYMRADITLAHHNHDTLEELGETVRHELLHVLHGPFESLLKHAMVATGERDDAFLRCAWRISGEQTVVQLERMLDLHGINYARLVELGRERRADWSRDNFLDDAEAEQR